MVESILSKVPFFASLPAEQLADLARAGRSRSVAAGGLVFSEGDQADGLYVIVEGRVRVYSRNERGTEVQLGLLGPGDYFGEVALLDGKPRSATVCSTESCTLFVLERHAFVDLVTRSPALFSDLLAGLSARIRHAHEKYFWELLKEQRLRSEMELERHQSLSAMVAGVAHELNTPLGIASEAASLIVTALDPETLLRMARDEEARTTLQDVVQATDLIQRQIGRASKLVQSFKKLSLLQNVDSRQEVDLVDVVEEIVGLFRLTERASALDVRVTNRLPDAARAWDGYPGYLTQALMGLLANAQRHAYRSDESGAAEVVLEVAPGSEADQHVQVTVRDFGRGIAPEHLGRIFDPFFTTSRGQDHSGLGLAIIRTVVSSGMCGSIEVESGPGSGAAFHLRLPRRLPPER